ncbi:imm11 family protein [Archangium gephyra]|uniref:imm11 family protein n=1 Tax=Archangium gephyra TaxID=48 RepID=UPI003B7B536A
MRFHELFFDSRIREQWVLAEPIDGQGEEIDPWQFFSGRPIALSGTPRIPVDAPGRALDFSFTTLSIPIVHARLAPLFERLGLGQQVQLLPVEVTGRTEPYFLVNVLRVLPCIDDARCERVEYWRPEDGAPDRVGDYRLVRGLRIDPSRAGDSDIFRPRGWNSVLLVSERLKDALEDEQVGGIRFTEV